VTYVLGIATMRNVANYRIWRYELSALSVFDRRSPPAYAGVRRMLRACLTGARRHRAQPEPMPLATGFAAVKRHSRSSRVRLASRDAVRDLYRDASARADLTVPITQDLRATSQRLRIETRQ
jgi:hypothetical protein